MDYVLILYKYQKFLVMLYNEIIKDINEIVYKYVFVCGRYNLEIVRIKNDRIK